VDPALVAAPAAHAPLLHAVAEYSPAVRVVVTAAVVSSIVGASAAAGEKGGVRRLAFVNARLIPCLMKASIERQLDAISTMLSHASPGGPASAATAGDAASGAAGGHRTRIERIALDVVDGFHDIVDGIADGVTEGDGAFKDARLMTQIGMSLGFVYLAFLTVWFWATRRHQTESEGV